MYSPLGIFFLIPPSHHVKSFSNALSLFLRRKMTIECIFFRIKAKINQNCFKNSFSTLTHFLTSSRHWKKYGYSISRFFSVIWHFWSSCSFAATAWSGSSEIDKMGIKYPYRRIFYAKCQRNIIRERDEISVDVKVYHNMTCVFSEYLRASRHV